MKQEKIDESIRTIRLGGADPRTQCTFAAAPRFLDRYIGLEVCLAP